ncbi:MAG: IS66 family transposase, partial [Cellulosilyticaceae bacterium]
MMDSTDQKELIQLLKETNEFLRKQNEDQQKQIQELTQTIVNLNETVNYMKKKLFGASSEKSKKIEVVQGQQNFFNEIEAHVDPSVTEPAIETILVANTKKSRKKKATREELLDQLPIIEVLCQLAPEDKFCSYCNTEMTVLGKKFVREELRITPAKVERIHYIQQTMICPQCKDDDVPVILTAKAPEPLIKHSLASPSTVAHVMYQKFVNAMPLYRQSKDWEQMGVKLPRATLANWVNKCGLDYLQPIYDHLHELLCKREFINADETPCQVLKEDGKAATSKSYMWLYASGNDGLPAIRLYEYQPGRSGKYPVAFLNGFAGYLCCDGYSGYNALENVTRCGCLAHMRRYWHEAIPATRLGKNTPQLPLIPAEIGLAYCNKLFELERDYMSLEPDERKQRRLHTESPVWEAYWAWIETVCPTGGSRLAKAVTYAKNQKPYMENYLLDGRCSISNNLAENIARPYAVGRKNFLFHDTVKGAKASAIIYSLIETAKANNINIL